MANRWDIAVFIPANELLDGDWPENVVRDEMESYGISVDGSGIRLPMGHKDVRLARVVGYEADTSGVKLYIELNPDHLVVYKG